MRILIVCRWHNNHAAGFIMEQVESLQSLGNEVRYCTANQGGIKGYMNLYTQLRHDIKSWHPDVIHAHYGICGLVANLASHLSFANYHVPVVTTYPGSDINSSLVRLLSILCIRLSAYNLFMSQHQMAKVARWLKKKHNCILRYGIQANLFVPMDKGECRRRMNLDENAQLVLFSSKFTRAVKDPELAKKSCQLANVQLLELTGGYTKQEMVWLMNAVDVALVTSKSEGSPQFTKEVMACGTPIVSVDVGDVAEQVKGVDGCYIASSRSPQELAELLQKALKYGRTNGHEKIIANHLDNTQVAQRLMDIYRTIVK